MAEASATFKTEVLMNISNNLIEVLKEEKDIANLRHFLRQASALQSQCDKDFSEVQKSIEDYENKIHLYKQKAAAAESESTAGAELDLLQKELEEEQNLERQLREELRYVFYKIVHLILDLSLIAQANNFYLFNTKIVNEFDDLEHKRETVEEQRQTIKKFEQDEVRAKRFLFLKNELEGFCWKTAMLLILCGTSIRLILCGTSIRLILCGTLIRGGNHLGWLLQTDGLLTTDYSSRSFSIVTGKVTKIELEGFVGKEVSSCNAANSLWNINHPRR